MAQYLEQMGIGVGQDLEEMMVMEAMRLSELEEAERKKKAVIDEASRGSAGAPVESNAEAGPSHAAGSPVNAAALSDAIAAPMGSSSPDPARPIAASTAGAPGQEQASAPASTLPPAVRSSPVFSSSDLDVLQSGAAGRASVDGGVRESVAAEPRADAPLVDL